jgi:hypothetical protein
MFSSRGDIRSPRRLKAWHSVLMDQHVGEFDLIRPILGAQIQEPTTLADVVLVCA